MAVAFGGGFQGKIFGTKLVQETKIVSSNLVCLHGDI
jgi:hypothetical protein